MGGLDFLQFHYSIIDCAFRSHQAQMLFKNTIDVAINYLYSIGYNVINLKRKRKE